MEGVRFILTDAQWAMLEAVITKVKSRAGAPPETGDSPRA